MPARQSITSGTGPTQQQAMQQEWTNEAHGKVVARRKRKTKEDDVDEEADASEGSDDLNPPVRKRGRKSLTPQNKRRKSTGRKPQQQQEEEGEETATPMLSPPPPRTPSSPPFTTLDVDGASSALAAATIPRPSLRDLSSPTPVRSSTRGSASILKSSSKPNNVSGTASAVAKKIRFEQVLAPAATKTPLPRPAAVGATPSSGRKLLLRTPTSLQKLREAVGSKSSGFLVLGLLILVFVRVLVFGPTTRTYSTLLPFPTSSRPAYFLAPFLGGQWMAFKTDGSERRGGEQSQWGSIGSKLAELEDLVIDLHTLVGDDQEALKELNATRVKAEIRTRELAAANLVIDQELERILAKTASLSSLHVSVAAEAEAAVRTVSFVQQQQLNALVAESSARLAKCQQALDESRDGMSPAGKQQQASETLSKIIAFIQSTHFGGVEGNKDDDQYREEEGQSTSEKLGETVRTLQRLNRVIAIVENSLYGGKTSTT